MLTEKHLDMYNKRVIRWLGKLGLKDYYVQVCLSDLGDDCIAGMCDADPENGNAILYLNKGADITDRQIKRTARHEVLELLLSAFYKLAQNRDFSFEEANKERHRIIRRLENLFEKEGIR